jgi:hypothetical protein
MYKSLENNLHKLMKAQESKTTTTAHILTTLTTLTFPSIRRAQVKVGLRLERRYSQRWNFAVSPGDGSVCQEKLCIHSIAAVCC